MSQREWRFVKYALVLNAVCALAGVALSVWGLAK